MRAKADVRGMSERTRSRCPSCRTTELLTVTFHVDGRETLFRVCPPCEAKWWERDGDKLDLPSALPLVAR
jgi:hypothetical protein